MARRSAAIRSSTFPTEVRVPIWGKLGGVLFLDGGNVWTKPWDFNPKDLRYDVGPGLRYNTPIGPIRVDFGYQLNPIPGLVVNGDPSRVAIVSTSASVRRSDSQMMQDLPSFAAGRRPRRHAHGRHRRRGVDRVADAVVPRLAAAVHRPGIEAVSQRRADASAASAAISSSAWTCPM